MNEDKIATISVHDLKEHMDASPNLCLIDVREPHEWQTLRIPGAQLLPKDQITNSIESVQSDKNQPVYLHCHSGARSLFAAYCLAEMGYTQIYSVNGGIVEWSMNGYPVEQ